MQACSQPDAVKSQRMREVSISAVRWKSSYSNSQAACMRHDNSIYQKTVDKEWNAKIFNYKTVRELFGT